MAALVRSDGDALCVFFNGTFHDLVYTTVMSQVNDLGALALQDAPHDVDGSIMAIEQGCSSNDTDLMRSRDIHTGSRGCKITQEKRD